MVHATQGDRPALFPDCPRVRSFPRLCADRVRTCCPPYPGQLAGGRDTGRRQWNLDEAIEAVELNLSPKLAGAHFATDLVWK